MPSGCVPSYVNVRTLASEMEISESQVYALVRVGVLPKPIRLSAGCVRWSWSAVEAALASLEEGRELEQDNDPDPIMRRIRDAQKAAKAT